MRCNRHGQKEIVFNAHGGKRRGGGRPPRGERALVSHASRPTLTGREPVLVTLKMLKHVWDLRTRRAFGRLMPTFLAARERHGMRLAHYSVQNDHVHLIVEAKDEKALSRGVQGLCVRIARALNRMMGRTGKVFADRYHARVLRTPRQLRSALAYVLCNARKHARAPRVRGWLDPYSSAPCFDGWKGLAPDPLARAAAIVVRPRTWLLSTGWRRAGGDVDPDHCPGAMPA